MVRLDPAQLEALAAAVSEGTFDAAAQRLHVTPSAVSQRVKALEVAVGRVLLRRSKPITPTPSGEAVLRYARQVDSLAHELAGEIGDQSEPGGQVVIPLAVNADSLATWLLPALASIGPPVVFDLNRSDQEHTADLLRQGSVMAAITSSATAVPGCTVRRLGRMRYHPMASRAFVRTWFADGVTPDALARAPVVVYDRDDDLQHRYLRRRSRRRLDPPRNFVPGSTNFLHAVRLGLGWGMIPDIQVPDVADSELVELDAAGAIDVTLYWQQWRVPSAVLDRVAGAVRAAAATRLIT